jgi:hypothetical protein
MKYNPLDGSGAIKVYPSSMTTRKLVEGLADQRQTSMSAIIDACIYVELDKLTVSEKENLINIANRKKAQNGKDSYANI